MPFEAVNAIQRNLRFSKILMVARSLPPAENVFWKKSQQSVQRLKSFPQVFLWRRGWDQKNLWESNHQRERKNSMNSIQKTKSLLADVFKSRLVTLLAVPCTAIMLQAAPIMPDFATLPTGWTTDRYEPASFANIGTYQGHANVLGIGIDATTGQNARPASYTSLFYSTQGRKYTFSPVEGPGSVLSADLYIPASWGDSANGHVRTDMWGTMVDSSTVVSAYPIIGFSNYGGVPRLRVWDGDGWVDLSTTITYDTWTAFAIELLADTSINYYVNGALVHTDATTGGSVAFKEVIMQAYNFEHSDIAGAIVAPYTAHWSNTQPPPALSCLGFEAPLDKPVVVKKANRVLPLRMTLVDEDGAIVSSITPPVVSVAYSGSYTYVEGELEELNSAGPGDDGNQFVFNGTFWAFNLKTKGLAPGTYTITAVSGNDTEYVIDPTCTALVEIE